MAGGAHERVPEPVAADVDELAAALVTASRALIGVSVRSLAEVDESVTLTQFRTLVVLAGADSRLNLNGLAERLGVNASTAMRMVDRLIAAELVTRRENPTNRREVLLGLTDAGERLVRQVTDHRRAAVAQIVAELPAGRRGELVAALTAFAEAAGEPPLRVPDGADPAW